MYSLCQSSKDRFFFVENATAQSLILRSLRRQTCPTIQIKALRRSEPPARLKRPFAARCGHPPGGNRELLHRVDVARRGCPGYGQLPQARAKKAKFQGDI